MPSSVRPWVTAGVAIVGAGVLAVAPLEPVPSNDVRTASSALELASAPNPFEYYPQVLLRTLGNAGDRLDEYLAEPLPILTAIAQNQYTAYADIVNAAGSFDPVAVATAILRAVAQPVLTLVKVISSGEPFDAAASLLVRMLPPLVSGVLAAGSATADVVKAFYDLDIVEVVSGMMNIPARTVDGLLNGRIDGLTDENLGLLTPVIDAPVADQITGPVAFLIESLQDIGDTIAPSSPDQSAAADQLPHLAAPVVTITPATPEKPAVQQVPAPQEAPRDTTSGGTPETPQVAPEPAEPEPTAPSQPEGSLPESETTDSDGPEGTTVGPTVPTDDSASEDDPSAVDPDDGSSDDGGSGGPGDGDSSGSGDGG